MRGLAQPMSTILLDEFVLSKPYFDQAGLIVAVDDQRPVGFVHAGFGPNDDESDFSTRRGITCVLMVLSHDREDEIAGRLLAQSEDYLRGRGAEELYAGGFGDDSPFYLGLYGGADSPGVLDADERSMEVFLSNGYRRVGRMLVFQRDLAGFRPRMDREQMQIRRQASVEYEIDPPARSWWEACTKGYFQRSRFDLIPRTGELPLASAIFWDMQPMSTSWGVRAVGLSEWKLSFNAQQAGLSVNLFNGALLQLRDEGYTLVEAQACPEDTATITLLAELDFEQVDAGSILRKE